MQRVEKHLHRSPFIDNWTCLLKAALSTTRRKRGVVRDVWRLQLSATVVGNVVDLMHLGVFVCKEIMNQLVELRHEDGGMTAGPCIALQSNHSGL